MPQNEVKFATVDAAEAGQRLDNFLIGRLKGVPRSMIYRIIRKGEVRVNRGRVKPERRLMAGDSVRIPPMRVAESQSLMKPSERLSNLLQSSILLDSAEFLVVNKPSGLAVHGGSGVSLGLIESLRQILGSAQYLELVHRLDRDTSGCIVVAKKRSALKYLQEQFREGRVDKFYLALAQGRWPKRLQLVAQPLKKNELTSGERMVRVDPAGKAAQTEFRVLEYYQSASLMEAKLLTGRTHQIRVHAQWAGHPLVGDTKYGAEEFNRVMKKQGLQRLFLHAAAIEFTPPNSDKLLRIEAPLPEDLEIGVQKLRDH